MTNYYCVDCMVYNQKDQVPAEYLYAGHSLCKNHALKLHDFIYIIERYKMKLLDDFRDKDKEEKE